jgi:hypothetical protein
MPTLELTSVRRAGLLVKDLLSNYDCAFVEQCMQYTGCPKYSPFIAANKPVFAIEYRDSSANCATANTLGIRLKWCAGSPADGVCSNNPLVNCYSNPTWDNGPGTPAIEKQYTTVPPTTNRPPSANAQEISVGSGSSMPTGAVLLFALSQLIIGIVSVLT